MQVVFAPAERRSEGPEYSRSRSARTPCRPRCRPVHPAPRHNAHANRGDDGARFRRERRASA
jgi:hypothetical protein